MIDGTMHIIMACHRRLERLPKTVEQLRAQDDPDWRLHLVLNEADHERKEQLLAAIVDEDRIEPPALNPQNEGGFARFILARMLFGFHPRPPEVVLFLDDDVDVRPDWIRYLRGAVDGAAVYAKSVWKFNKKPTFSADGLVTDLGGSYWDRVPEQSTCGDGDYAATQAMSCPTKLVLDPGIMDVSGWQLSGFIDDLIGVEDLWLSFLATKRGFWLRPLAKMPCSIVSDGKDTWPKVREKKTKLLHLLRARHQWRR